MSARRQIWGTDPVRCVAFLNGSSEIKSFAGFAGNKGFIYDPFYFDTTAEMAEALQSGNVDAIAASSLRKTNNGRHRA